jgi:hypothetical protein
LDYPDPSPIGQVQYFFKLSKASSEAVGYFPLRSIVLKARELIDMFVAREDVKHGKGNQTVMVVQVAVLGVASILSSFAKSSKLLMAFFKCLPVVLGPSSFSLTEPHEYLLTSSVYLAHHRDLL